MLLAVAGATLWLIPSDDPVGTGLVVFAVLVALTTVFAFIDGFTSRPHRLAVDAWTWLTVAAAVVVAGTLLEVGVVGSGLASGEPFYEVLGLALMDLLNRLPLTTALVVVPATVGIALGIAARKLLGRLSSRSGGTP